MMLLNTRVVGSCYFKIRVMAFWHERWGMFYYRCCWKSFRKFIPSWDAFLEKRQCKWRFTTYHLAGYLELQLFHRNNSRWKLFHLCQNKQKSFLHIWGILYLKLRACPWKLVVRKLLPFLFLGRPTCVPSAATINRQERTLFGGVAPTGTT